MSTINERISQVVLASKLTKTAFAEKLHVSQAFISKLCANGNPSDRTVTDICREFGVDETWLRTGEGDMLQAKSRTEEISAFLGDVMKSPEDNFRRRLVSVLAKLNENEWELIAKMAARLAEDTKKEAGPEGPAQ